jgi:hypothetical protein
LLVYRDSSQWWNYIETLYGLVLNYNFKVSLVGRPIWLLKKCNLILCLYKKNKKIVDRHNDNST